MSRRSSESEDGSSVRTNVRNAPLVTCAAETLLRYPTKIKSKWYKTLFVALFLVSVSASAQAGRPNILWIVIEDMSAHFGYDRVKVMRENLALMKRWAEEGK